MDQATSSGYSVSRGKRVLPRRSVLYSFALLGSAACTPGGRARERRAVVNVAGHGAVGDGRTDDTEAIRSAVHRAVREGGGIVIFPPTGTGYLCDQVVLESGVQLRGLDGARLFKRGNRPRWITSLPGARDVALVGLILDTRSVATSCAVTVAPDTRQFTMQDCHVSRSAQSSMTIGLETQESARNVVVRGCRFDGLSTPIQVTKDPIGVSVENCRLTNWTERGIRLVGTGATAANRVQILDNVIHPPIAGGDVRQPIQFNGSDTNPFSHVRIVGNIVRGVGSAYHDSATPGTADLISLHRCVDFEVRDNVCVGGGDTGVTVSQQSSRGAVVGNVCRDNNSAGICIGSGTSRFVRDIVVASNTCIDNGRDGAGYFPDSARAGIRLYHASSVRVVRNRVGNSAGSQSQQYGISVTDSASIKYYGNRMASNSVAPVLGEVAHR